MLSLVMKKGGIFSIGVYLHNNYSHTMSTSGADLERNWAGVLAYNHSSFISKNGVSHTILCMKFTKKKILQPVSCAPGWLNRGYATGLRNSLVIHEIKFVPLLISIIFNIWMICIKTKCVEFSQELCTFQSNWPAWCAG